MLTGGMKNETILASFSRALLAVGEMLGAPRAALLEGAGLSEADVRDPDGRVPIERQFALWQVIDRYTEQPIGLMLGQNAAPEVFGVVGHAARQEPTVGAALELLWRFRRLVGGPIIGQVRAEKGEAFLYKVIPAELLHIRHFGEAFSAGMISFVRHLCGGEPHKPRRVLIQHGPPKDLEPLREAFGCPIEFHAAETAVVYDAALLLEKTAPGDRTLMSYLASHAEELLRKLPAPGEELADRARRALFEELRGGDPSADRVARKLGVSKRTLQRKLREGGVEFSALLDEARRDLSVQYLKQPTLAVYEVAYLLGYAEPSAFFRSFKRWTGKTPSELRQELGVAA